MVVAAVWAAIRWHEAGQRVWAKNPEPSCWAQFLVCCCQIHVGVMEGGSGLWGVRLLLRFGLPFNGTRQSGGFGLKIWNRAARAQFWVCCCQQHAGVMEGGGGLWHVQWLRWFGLPFDGARQGGFGAKTPKPSG